MIEAMEWSGEFTLGEHWAAYRGRAAHNDVHSHAAIQLVFGDDKDVTVFDGRGWCLRNSAILIRPMVQHSVSGDGVMSMLFIEPHSPIARAVLDQAGAERIAPFPTELIQRIDTSQPVASWVNDLSPELPNDVGFLDPRLAIALDYLANAPRVAAIAKAAKNCGLSDSRLRTLAREQLGVPLSTWLVWRKLERAARELASGASHVDAAIAGGFSDQAHFARTMRRMFGVTPTMAIKTLR